MASNTGTGQLGIIERKVLERKHIHDIKEEQGRSLALKNPTRIL
jgi:hypothetical protein